MYIYNAARSASAQNRPVSLAVDVRLHLLKSWSRMHGVALSAYWDSTAERQYDDPHLHINSLWLAAATRSLDSRTRTPPSQRRVCEASALDIWSSDIWSRVAGHCLDVVVNAITANQQQSMGIQLVHLKGNRGALEAFMMLMRYKNPRFA